MCGHSQDTIERRKAQKIKQVLKSEQQLIHYELTTVEFFEHQTL
ncbi:hypothetical protein XNC1_0358 [Xenorhabdus nematophila ATCC 19061]|uniref:Uncharacterized protein n=1 Tax=Xenorhabdus nematophila (strain ATCC 19061 / DSM 3370 / CCUG 14189 / LMG 1036 / NCIMB 9965 / AN6) TaxID=406817 RepID=D3VH83_XENNA|nr:hypothetical protein XNC1_0280 [Xenorhabdus nematophila ATCC 19061]CBJ88440.1 hypothetical protein XNC1_0358 [Xenorhabdus nematophila ATCC 19061]